MCEWVERSSRRAGVGATAVRIYRPAERHPRALRHLVQRRSRLDLVEADPKRLGRVEGTDDSGLAEAGQPRLGLLSLDLQIIPSHELMFAQAADGPPGSASPLRPRSGG